MKKLENVLSEIELYKTIYEKNISKTKEIIKRYIMNEE